MVDNRQRTRDPFDDDNGYGDVPSGAVGTRGLRGREYIGGYGRNAKEFGGGIVDDGHGGPRDDAGDMVPRGHNSGYGAFGYTDRDDDRRGPERDEDRRYNAGPHRGLGPKGYQRSDERIREDVCERLTDDPFIDASDIEVVVRGREVTLSGTVASRGLRRRVEDLAEMASGVTHVQNDLRVRSTP
jgi:BON domain